MRPTQSRASTVTSCEVFHQIVDTWVQHAKKNYTQSDLRICENEGSNRFKINEKVGHLD